MERQVQTHDCRNNKAMATKHYYALYCYCGQKAIYVFTSCAERNSFTTRKKFTSSITANSAHRLMKNGVQVAADVTVRNFIKQTTKGE